MSEGAKIHKSIRFHGQVSQEGLQLSAFFMEYYYYYYYWLNLLTL